MQAPMSELSSENHENGYEGQSNAFDGQNDDNREKPLQIVGMAKKAGLLAIGSDDVQAAVRMGKAKLIIFASDTSEGTIRRTGYEAERAGVLNINTQYTKFELSRIAGRGSPGTLAFLDWGLAELFSKRLSALDMARYGKIARLLEAKVTVQKANKAGKANRAANADKADKPDNRRA